MVEEKKENETQVDVYIWIYRNYLVRIAYRKAQNDEYIEHIYRKYKYIRVEWDSFYSDLAKEVVLYYGDDVAPIVDTVAPGQVVKLARKEYRVRNIFVTQRFR